MPIQQPKPCCCRHPDAKECTRIRGYCLHDGLPSALDDEDECECACHHEDEDGRTGWDAPEPKPEMDRTDTPRAS
jgi:hypothetical protein